MKRQYEVLVARETRQQQIVTVEADSLEDAIETAEQDPERYCDDDRWEDDREYVGDYYFYEG